MRSLFLSVVFVLLLLSSSGCPTSDSLAGMTDSTFVDLMARLHRIENDARLSREERDSLRALALEQESVRPEQLEAAARSLAGDPDRALAIWQAIQARVDEAPEQMLDE